MQVRAKVKVESTRNPSGGLRKVKLVQVADPNDTGKPDLHLDPLTVSVRNPALAEFLQPGREFHLDLTLVEPEG